MRWRVHDLHSTSTLHRAIAPLHFQAALLARPLPDCPLPPGSHRRSCARAKLHLNGVCLQEYARAMATVFDRETPFERARMVRAAREHVGRFADSVFMDDFCQRMRPILA